MPTSPSPMSPTLPLERWRLFASRDLDEARERVARVFCPHRLEMVERGGRLDACHHVAPLHRHVSLNYVQYGAAVRIEPGCLGSFYLLQIPLRGGADVRCGNTRMEAHGALASLPSPTEPLSMRWHDDSPHLIVRLDREAVRTQLESLLQVALEQGPVFDLAVDLARPELHGLSALVGYLRDALDSPVPISQQAQLAEQAERHLICTLLLSAPHDWSAMLGRPPGRDVIPGLVRRAQDYMRADVDRPLTLADVCNHVGVAARTLQAAFRRHTGDTPMAWLRDLRLQRVRAELLAHAGAGTVGRATLVADVAARHGFFHLGHFGAHYRRRFGETPSSVLKR